jgi:hypothetical protein
MPKINLISYLVLKGIQKIVFSKSNNLSSYKYLIFFFFFFYKLLVVANNNNINIIIILSFKWKFCCLLNSSKFKIVAWMQLISMLWVLPRT